MLPHVADATADAHAIAFAGVTPVCGAFASSSQEILIRSTHFAEVPYRSAKPALAQRSVAEHIAMANVVQLTALGAVPAITSVPPVTAASGAVLLLPEASAI